MQACNALNKNLDRAKKKCALGVGVSRTKLNARILVSKLQLLVQPVHMVGEFWQYCFQLGHMTKPVKRSNIRRLHIAYRPDVRPGPQLFCWQKCFELKK